MDNVISLSEARANLSSIGSEVVRSGVSYIVTIRNKPAFLIKPYVPARAGNRSMKGVLSDLSDPDIRALERLAGDYHAEERYDEPA